MTKPPEQPQTTKPWPWAAGSKSRKKCAICDKLGHGPGRCWYRSAIGITNITQMGSGTIYINSYFGDGGGIKSLQKKRRRREQRGGVRIKGGSRARSRGQEPEPVQQIQGGPDTDLGESTAEASSDKSD